MDSRNNTVINKGASRDNVVNMYKDILNKIENTKEEEMKVIDVKEENIVNQKIPALIIGMGQCGANIADLAHKENFYTCAVNTSREDIEKCSVDEKFIYENAKGSGKERSRSKNIFASNADQFISFLNDKFFDIPTYIVVCSAGGGTGGGAGPMCANFLKSNFPDKNIFLMVVLGSIAEDIKSQENTAEVFEELLKADVNYLVFDNDRAKGYDNIDSMYYSINKDVIDACKFISRIYFLDNSRSNIDEMDMQKLYLENKRMLIVSGNFDKKISSRESYTEQMLNAIKNSSQVPPTGNPMSYAFFMSVEDKIYDSIDTNFRDIVDVYGESYETYKHLQQQYPEAPDFVICMTGLSDCVERYEYINLRIADFKSRVEYDRSMSDVEKVTINARNNAAIKLPSENKKKSDEIDKSSLSKFM
jgi:cell division GTPase FtsZ